MYEVILVPLEHSATDRAIIDHIKPLAKTMNSRVVLLHVAAGASARYHGPNAASLEVEQGREYIGKVRQELADTGISADAELAFGEPAKEIINWVKQHPCDLVAMSTHGHHFVADLVLGTTAIKVQHNVSVPVMLLRAR